MTIPELEERLRQRDTRIEELEKEIKELKQMLLKKAKSKEAKPPKEASNYSVSRYERKGGNAAIRIQPAGNPRVASKDGLRKRSTSIGTMCVKRNASCVTSSPSGG